MRTNALIERVRSIRTDPCIPWEEWGEGATVLEIPLYIDNFSTFVHGTHVATVVGVNSGIPDHSLYTFDFSKRGRHALQLWSGDGRTEGRASVKVAPTYLELIALICAYSVLIFDAIKISTE